MEEPYVIIELHVTGSLHVKKFKMPIDPEEWAEQTDAEHDKVVEEYIVSTLIDYTTSTVASL